MRTPFKLAITALSLSLSASCVNTGRTTEAADCGQAQAMSYQDHNFCVYTNPIIETRFECPPQAPFEHILTEHEIQVCAPESELPEGFTDWIDEEHQRWEGSNPDPIVQPPTPVSACEAGIGQGCNDTLAPKSGATLLTGSQIATKLAQLIWDDAPDAQLLAAAQDGSLSTRSGVRLQALRMLEDTRAQGPLNDFWSDYLGLNDITSQWREPATYPNFSPQLAELTRTSALTFIHDLTMVRGDDVRALFKSSEVLVNQDLAPLFGLNPNDYSAQSWDLAAPQDRAGIQSHPSFLIAHGGSGSHTQPSIRGVALKRLLCQEIPPEPANAQAPKAPNNTPMTGRQQLVEQTSDAACAACHNLIDPPAFSLEGFDNIGQPRAVDNGLPVDISGDLDGASFNTIHEFATLYSQDPRLTSCITRRLAEHLLDTSLQAQNSVLSAALIAWGQQGYKFPELVLILVSSDLFLYE